MIGVNNHFSLGFDDCEINNIKDNRDSVVHSNLFSSDVNPVKDLRQIQLFAQKTFLKILNYDGVFINYYNNAKFEKIT